MLSSFYPALSALEFKAHLGLVFSYEDAKELP
jgi:hypothetical protein